MYLSCIPLPNPQFIIDENCVTSHILQLKVLPKDLQLCTEMATGVDSMGQFQFGEMVQLE